MNEQTNDYDTKTARKRLQRGDHHVPSPYLVLMLGKDRKSSSLRKYERKSKWI